MKFATLIIIIIIIIIIITKELIKVKRLQEKCLFEFLPERGE